MAEAEQATGTGAAGHRAESPEPVGGRWADRLATGTIFVIAALWLIGAGFVALPAPFIIDGYIFEAMSDAFARSGSLFLDNGVADYGNPSLAILLTRIVDGALVPQYPGLWGIISGPFYGALGPRALMLLNALASVATMALTWRLGVSLFGDRALARNAALLFGLATFAVDYAFGLWPQAFSATFLVAALLTASEAVRGDVRREPLLAALAGLILGVGLCFRVDMLFFLPALWLWLLAAGRRPYPSLTLYLIGLLPGMALSSAINMVKFGSFVPVSYGTEAGATDVMTWLPLLYLAAAVAIASLALGLSRVRAIV
ncbi:MAG: glycosyltransferase family 39 protein, partial [Pseudomonadota bacterium]